MTTSSPLGPRRECLRCGTSEEIDASSALWPEGWRCRACDFAPPRREEFVQLAPELDDLDEGFSLASYDGLRAMEDGHFWFAARNEMISWLVRHHAAHATRVLEIGCGTGYVLFALRKALPAARIAGSELHSLGLRHARRRHGHDIELLQMDARHGGLSGVFGLVGAFDVLEHIADDERVLREIHRMLQPGGILIATVPQHPWLWSDVDNVAHHQRRYATGELAAKAEAAGFHIRYKTSFATLSLPLLALSRWRSKKSAAAANSETTVPKGVNAALRALFQLEHALRRMGTFLPIGGSSVLVAEKLT